MTKNVNIFCNFNHGMVVGVAGVFQKRLISQDFNTQQTRQFTWSGVETKNPIRTSGSMLSIREVNSQTGLSSREVYSKSNIKALYGNDERRSSQNVKP